MTAVYGAGLCNDITLCGIGQGVILGNFRATAKPSFNVLCAVGGESVAYFACVRFGNDSSFTAALVGFLMGRAIFVSGIGKFCACVVVGVNLTVFALTDGAVSLADAGSRLVAHRAGGVVGLGAGGIGIVGVADDSILCAGIVAVVDLRAAEDGIILGADGLTPSLLGLVALEQVSHLAGGELLDGFGGGAIRSIVCCAARCGAADAVLNGIAAVLGAAGQVVAVLDDVAAVHTPAHHAADLGVAGDGAPVIAALDGAAEGAAHHAADIIVAADNGAGVVAV